MSADERCDCDFCRKQRHLRIWYRELLRLATVLAAAPGLHAILGVIFGMDLPSLWLVGVSWAVSLLCVTGGWLVRRHGISLIDERRSELMQLAMLSIAAKAFETGKPVLGTVSPDGKVESKVRE